MSIIIVKKLKKGPTARRLVWYKKMKAIIKVYRGEKVIYKNKKDIFEAVEEEKAIIEEILNHTACVNLMNASKIELKCGKEMRVTLF